MKTKPKANFDTIVVIHTSKLKIEERRTIKKVENTEAAVQELLDKYEKTSYDVVVTYGGPFDMLAWLQLRQLEKTEVN
tara:strand:- start:713 stop:946 length:234 start_codon:yes stop_codon:yes gene_type:complete